MNLLTKDNDTLGLAAHIPDTHGGPLCHLNLNLAHWHIGDRLPTSLLICHHCLRALAKQALAANVDRPTSLEQSLGVGDVPDE
jgi:hypothetical protein